MDTDEGPAKKQCTSGHAPSESSGHAAPSQPGPVIRLPKSGADFLSWHPSKRNNIKHDKKLEFIMHDKKVFPSGEILCKVCDQMLNGEEQYQDHCIGKKHRKKSKAAKAAAAEAKAAETAAAEASAAAPAPSSYQLFSAASSSGKNSSASGSLFLPPSRLRCQRYSIARRGGGLKGNPRAELFLPINRLDLVC